MKYSILICVFLIMINACNSNHNSTNTSDSVAIANDSEVSAATDSTELDSIQDNNDSAIDSRLQEIGGNPLIVPGESIGKISLGMDASNLQIILGKPNMSDAAMGKAWSTWYGKNRDEHNNKTELDVYTAYKDASMRQQTVQQIRTTSSFFKTENGVHVYSSLDDIKKAYPFIKRASKYKQNGVNITIFDDRNNGIAFETAPVELQSICIGIIIHQKQKSVNDVYITLHPDMKRLRKDRRNP